MHSVRNWYTRKLKDTLNWFLKKEIWIRKRMRVWLPWGNNLLCVSARLITWVNMLCAGPLGRGQQGWSGVEEEEEGQGGALTVRRHPNPITDCCHSAAGREGWTDRGERVGQGRWKSTASGDHKTRQEKGGEREKQHVCGKRKRKDKQKLVWA